MGLDSNQDILDTFGDDDRLIRTLEKDNTKNSDEGVKEIYRRLRPGDPPTVVNARSMLNSLLFDARRYDLAKVGRYKYNKKLGIHNRLVNSYAAEDIIDPNTGEILVEKDGFISRAKAYKIENAGVLSALIRSKNENDDSVAKVIGNQFVDPTGYVDIDLAPYKLSELVYYPVLAQILEEKTGTPTVIYTPEQTENRQNMDQDPGHGRNGRQDQKEQRQKQDDSFAQQLRLGLT